MLKFWRNKIGGFNIFLVQKIYVKLLNNLKNPFKGILICAGQCMGISEDKYTNTFQGKK